MNESSIPTIVMLMNDISHMANQMLMATKSELHSAKERSNKKRFVEFIHDLKILERLIKIVNFIALDLQKKAVSPGTFLLMSLSTETIETMIHSVAAKRNLHEKIINSFKEANALMDNEF